MDFDRYTVVLLLTPENPPQLSEDEADRLQDAHLSHLADLHDRGELLAAGPLGDPSGRRHYRGLSILRCEPDRALRLNGEDPAVRAGIFDLVAMPWMLPAGAIHFTPTTFPAVDPRRVSPTGHARTANAPRTPARDAAGPGNGQEIAAFTSPTTLSSTAGLHR